MTNNYNDEFRIIIDVPELNIKLQNLDIDYQVSKTVTSEPDVAHFNIWNVDEEVYKKLLGKNFKVKVYTRYYDEVIQIIFSGNLVNIEYKNLIPIGNPNCSAIKISRDTLMKIKLVNSGNKLQEHYINKTYRDQVSSTQIINDCMEVMGINNINYVQNLPEKSYPNFKALGKPHVVISDVCKALGCDYLIQNEILYLGLPNSDSLQTNITELNCDNSLFPVDKNLDEKIITTGLKSSINPYDLVNCNFEGFEGIYYVSEVFSEGNNYNSDGITQLTIRLT